MSFTSIFNNSKKKYIIYTIIIINNYTLIYNIIKLFTSCLNLGPSSETLVKNFVQAILHFSFATETTGSNEL